MADNFDGFSANLFQDEDGDWLAHLVEMPGISAFADTPAAPRQNRVDAPPRGASG